MKFTVVWKPEAEQQLAAIWLLAADRKAIASSTDRLERALSSRPDTIGEERPDNRRIAFVDPLAVIYQVSVEDRFVEVASVWTPDIPSQGHDDHSRGF